MKKRTRKGFTLIELLIVIIVIGILSANMALMSNRSTSSAKVANIINNLKTMQSAASLYFFDHINSKDSEVTTANITTASPDYLGDAVKSMTGYGFVISTPATAATDKVKHWYVYYNFSAVDDFENTEIKNKLAEKASSVGLLGTMSVANLGAKITTPYTGNINQSYILLQVR